LIQRLAAVQASQVLHPDIVELVIGEKFDSAVSQTADDFYGQTLWLLSACTDLQSYLKEATWIKLENYIRNLPAEETDAVSYSQYSPRLTELGIQRLNQCDEAELTAAVERLRGKPADVFINKCISVYEESYSWATANTKAARLITPLLKYMNADHARQIVAAGTNGEVRESHQYPYIVKLIKSGGLLTEQELAKLISDNDLSDALGHLISTPESYE
jgi:hypothetical protein